MDAYLHNCAHRSLADALFTFFFVASRLFELVAEEIAIEDTIYYLDQALSQDKVELNAYMKVRSSSR